MHSRLAAVLLLVVGLLAALPILGGRLVREETNRQVDLVIDLPSFRKVARADGLDEVDFLRELRAAGVTGAAIPEVLLDNLGENMPATARRGGGLRHIVASAPGVHPFLRELVLSGRVTENYTYVVTDRRDTAEKVRHELERRMPEGTLFLLEHAAEPYLAVFELAIPAERLGKLQLAFGFVPEEFALVREAGLRPVPRPANYPLIDAAGVREVFDEIARLAPETRTVIFAGAQMLGYPQHLDLTAALLQERGWILGLVEHWSQLHYILQDGFEELAERLDYGTARVHSFDRRELDRYTPADTVERWVRSAKERNIRVLYLRPFHVTEPGLTMAETNVKYMRLLAERLQEVGLEPGAPVPFPSLTIQPLHAAAVGLGVIGGGVLWLGFFWPWRDRFLLALGGAGALAVPAMVYVAPNTGTLALAFGAAVIFPTLGATWCVRRWVKPSRRCGRTLWEWARLVSGEGFWAVLVVVAAALAGGLLIASLLGDIRYLLEFRYFRGVKLAFLLPLILVTVAYLVLARSAVGRLNQRDLLADIKDMLRRPLAWGHVAVGLAGLFVLYVYMVRSGNVIDFPLIELEMRLRNLLEQVLWARPRTKEFLIGYPALVAAAAAWRLGLQAWLWPLVIAGTTAGVSVVNSFSHLRTPVLISLVRSLHGAWLGLFFGVLAGLLLVWAVTLWLPDDGRRRGG